MAQRAELVAIGGHEVQITHPDKVLFPQDDITKRDLIDYYRRIAPRMLPYLRGRPLALERYPDGIDKTRIFQKAAAGYFPEWIQKATVKKVGGTVRHVICDNTATLVYLANQACITPHTWLSRITKLQYPDQMIFDLDPSGRDFALVKSAARSLKRLLDELDLPAYLKTTGSRGLHIAIPLKGQEDFDAVRAFARDLAAILVADNPAHWTLEQRKGKRRGRVFIDTNRNAYAQTVAPAYAARARRGAPISVPLSWNELQTITRSDGVTIRTIFDRLDGTKESWGDFRRRSVSLKPLRSKLDEIKATRRVSEETNL